MDAIPLVDEDFVLDKFPGKGGWTYAVIPQILPATDRPFGWVLVKGRVDSYEFRQYHLMPMGSGRGLFLPVKAAVRKQIGKGVGDTVHITLYADEYEQTDNAEFMECLADAPEAMNAYKNLKSSVQSQYINYIESSKNAEVKVQRMAEVIEKLQRI
jgi:hypothetical protein